MLVAPQAGLHDEAAAGQRTGPTVVDSPVPNPRRTCSGRIPPAQASTEAYVALSLTARPCQVAEANAEHKELLNIYQRRDEQAAVRLTVQRLQATLAAIEEAHAGLSRTAQRARRIPDQPTVSRRI